MDIIKQGHKHELVLQWVDGKLVYKCLHHECEYVEEIKPAEAWEQEL